MRKEELNTLRDVLMEIENYLYNDLEAICDKEYAEETSKLLEKVIDEITILNTGAYSMVLSPLFIEYFPSVIVKDGDNYMVAREKWGTNEFVQKNNLYK